MQRCADFLLYVNFDTFKRKSNKKHHKTFGGLGNKYYLCTRNSEMRLLTIK